MRKDGITGLAFLGQLGKGTKNVVTSRWGMFTIVHENVNVLVFETVHVFNVCNLYQS